MAELSGGDSVDTAFSAVAQASTQAPRAYNYARSHRIAEVFGLLFGSALLAITAWRAVHCFPSGATGPALLCVFAGAVLGGRAVGLRTLGGG